MNNRQAPILINKKRKPKNLFLQIEIDYFDKLSYALKDKPKQLVMMILLIGTKDIEIMLKN